MPLKFDPNGVRETYGKMFLTLWNVYKFHADYAALDGFDPDAIDQIPVAERKILTDGFFRNYLRLQRNITQISSIGITTKHVET